MMPVIKWLHTVLFLGRFVWNLRLESAPPLRLVNGRDSCSGRLEALLVNQWGTVCNKGWDLSDSTVACRELGCGAAVGSAYFGPGTGPIWSSEIQCTGSEALLSECSYQWPPFNCSHSNDVGVVCGSVIRLVNGSHTCFGRVEVFYGGQWGTVCDDAWDMQDAQVACLEAGCGNAVQAKTNAYFGQGSGPVWMSNVSCTGSEYSLGNCLSAGWGNNSCDHENDAGVTCSRKIKLINGFNAYSGGVEMFIDSQWGAVCDDDWGLLDAEVACHEMGCQDVIAAKTHAYFGQSTDPTRVGGVQCDGSEVNLRACDIQSWAITNCPHVNDAGVKCSPPVRMVDGMNSCSGRVEVFFAGQWGTICDDDWSMFDAAVLCKEVGCGGAVQAKVGGYFGPGQGPVWLSGLQCKTETSVRYCNSSGLGTNSCEQRSDAGAICQTKTQLVGGLDPCSGRVEVLYNGQWGRVCDSDWDLLDATVVCVEMGCGEALEEKTGSFFGQSNATVWMDAVNCTGDEIMLNSCDYLKSATYTCDVSRNAGVVCDFPVRLVDGQDSCSGRVEVLHAGQWGTVCDDGWDVADAAVVCAELGCGSLKAVKGGAYFGQGAGPVWLSSVNCANVSTLRSCESSGWGNNSCGHEKDAGVVCQGNVRLVNGTDGCSGRVQLLYNRQWGTVCDSGWDAADAEVVCRQLGCGTALDVRGGAYFGKGYGSVLLTNVSCVGNESTLVNCGFDQNESSCGHERDAGVECGYVEVTLRIEVKAAAGVDPNQSGVSGGLLQEVKNKLNLTDTSSMSFRFQPDGRAFQIQSGP